MIKCNGKNEQRTMWVNDKTEERIHPGESSLQVEGTAVQKPCDCGAEIDPSTHYSVWPHDEILADPESTSQIVEADTGPASVEE